jgi:hypothetical protein
LAEIGGAGAVVLDAAELLGGAVHQIERLDVA